MKKILLTAAAVMAASGTVFAQNGIKVLPNPSSDELIMFAVSPNGRYVGGYTNIDKQPAVYDTQENKLVLVGEPEPDGDNHVRSISNDGKFTTIDGAMFAADGTLLQNFGEEALPKGITADGNTVVGAIIAENGYTWNSCYWDGNTTVFLPEPSEKWAGWTSLDPDDPSTVQGSSADFVSTDKSVIVGSILDNMSTYPLAIWRQNKDGKTYSLDFVSHRYFDNDFNGSRPYTYFQAGAMSPNGKWVALSIGKGDPETQDENFGLARFNVDTEELETYFYDEESGVQVAYATGISDDGTLVGISGGMMSQVGTIWEVGAEAPVTLADRYPGVTQFAEYDEAGHMVGGISADGRYIVGYGYFYRDNGTIEDDSDDTAGYESYIFDTQDPGSTNAVKTVTTSTVKDRGEKKYTIYTLDGKQIKSHISGINIMRNSERAFKTLKK